MVNTIDTVVKLRWLTRDGSDSVNKERILTIIYN